MLGVEVIVISILFSKEAANMIADSGGGYAAINAVLVGGAILVAILGAIGKTTVGHYIHIPVSVIGEFLIFANSMEMLKASSGSGLDDFFVQAVGLCFFGVICVGVGCLSGFISALPAKGKKI